MLSIEAAAVLGEGNKFDDWVIEIGLLGVLVVLLGLPAPEREPA